MTDAKAKHVLNRLIMNWGSTDYLHNRVENLGPVIKRGDSCDVPKVAAPTNKDPDTRAAPTTMTPTVDTLTELFREGGVKPVFIPADEIAREVGHIQALNMVMLGALVAVSNIVDTESAVKTIRETIENGVDINVEGFWKGYEFISGKDYN